MVSAAARNGGSQSGMTLLLSRKRSVSPDQLRRMARGLNPSYAARSGEPLPLEPAHIQVESSPWPPSPSYPLKVSVAYP
jgi:hypothetical protein